jgi:hypothetical protein
MFPCRGSGVPCRTLLLVSATCKGTVNPWFGRPAASGDDISTQSRTVRSDPGSSNFNCRLQALTELGIVCSRVPVGLSPTRTLHRFWGNFRLGGDPPATREGVENDLQKCLDEWVGGLCINLAVIPF